MSRKKKIVYSFVLLLAIACLADQVVNPGLPSGFTGVTNQLQAPAGAVGTPAYSFSGDTNTGMWDEFPATHTVTFSCNGAECMDIAPTNVSILNASQFGWAANFSGGPATGLHRLADTVVSVGNGSANNMSGSIFASGNRAALTADWTCGTGGTVTSCTSATIIGSGGGVPLTFTLPLVAASYQWECNLVVGQATGATANTWSVLTATNGATNVTASYDMYTAATAKAGGAVTDQASTTTAFAISPNWTLGGTATKMPVRIWGEVEGASASGTVLSLELTAPTVGDLVTIYRGSECHIK